jgi:hypothetical protein
MIMADGVDFSRLLRLNSDNGAFSANIGVFGGMADISVFENDKKEAPVVKMLLDFAAMYQLRSLLLKALENEEMKPIDIGYWPWNKDLKMSEFRSNISIGRDINKCIYFDFTGVAHKEPIRMSLVANRTMRINNQELPKQYATEIGANAIIDVMSQVLGIGIAMTRRARGDFNASHAQTSKSDEDNNIPF